MTKDIKVTDKVWWSAAFGLHEWALEYVSRSIGDPALTAEITEIIEENLPLFSVPEQSPDLQRKILHVLATSLVAEAERSLPETEGRTWAVEHLKKLADMARAAEL